VKVILGILIIGGIALTAKFNRHLTKNLSNALTFAFMDIILTKYQSLKAHP